MLPLVTIQMKGKATKLKRAYIDGCFSFCFVILLKLNQIQNTQRTEKYFSRGQAFASFQHGFLRSAENVGLHNVSDSVWEDVNLYNINTVVLCIAVK